MVKKENRWFHCLRRPGWCVFYKLTSILAKKYLTKSKLCKLKICENFTLHRHRVQTDGSVAQFFLGGQILFKFINEKNIKTSMETPNSAVQMPLLMTFNK